MTPHDSAYATSPSPAATRRPRGEEFVVALRGQHHGQLRNGALHLLRVRVRTDGRLSVGGLVIRDVPSSTDLMEIQRGERALEIASAAAQRCTLCSLRQIDRRPARISARDQRTATRQQQDVT
jgi:hypothetical protein